MVEAASSRPSSSAGRLVATDDKTIIRDRDFRLRALAITATALIARTNLAEASPVRLLDNAATFATTASLVSKLGKAGRLRAKGDHLRITATSHLVSDPAMPYDTLVQKAKAEGWDDVELRQADMLNLPFPKGTFTHVITNKGILFCRDDDTAIKEISRILRPGGIVGFSSWKSFGKLKAPKGSDITPDDVLSDALSLFPSSQWRDPVYINAKLRRHGFTDIQITEQPVTNDVLQASRSEADQAVEAIVETIVSKALATVAHADTGDAEYQDMADVLKTELRSRDLTTNNVAYIITARKGEGHLRKASTDSMLSPR